MIQDDYLLKIIATKFQDLVLKVHLKDTIMKSTKKYLAEITYARN